MFKLRPYQEEAVRRIMLSKDIPGNDIVCIAQGGGKSLIIADVASKLGKVLVICPNKEILEQNVDKMQHYVNKDKIGIYSASMNEKTIKKITFGTIGSMYKKSSLFIDFNIVIFDESDLHNPKKIDSMSNKLFIGAKIKKVFGFTGTPYRQDVYYKYPPGYSGNIWEKKNIEAITTTKMINRYASGFWKRIIYVLNTKDLINDGYLSNIIYHDLTLLKHKQIPINKSKSDFDVDSFSTMIGDDYDYIAKKIMELPHKSKLVFCANLDQATILYAKTPNSEIVDAKTPKKLRSSIVSDFKSGKIGIIYNVGIFTVGFDYPDLDCLIILRPTRSLRLHSQIIGRVSRRTQTKKIGHVYDFVNNVESLGKLEDIIVKKTTAYYNGKPYQAWNVVSPTFPDGFHMKPLYNYLIKGV